MISNQVYKTNSSQELYWQRACKRDMTYILGAKCKDGIVLVGDTKITIGGGADIEYSRKITFPLTYVVMGSAGAEGLYRDFQNKIQSEVIRIQDEVRRTNIPSPYIISEPGFSSLVTDTIRRMHTNFGQDRYMLINDLMILCATQIDVFNPQLNTFDGYGVPEPVNEIRAIGHGKPYGALFHKKLWKKSMTMEQTAKLGLFIIKFIEKMELDNSVGYTSDFLPQVVYIPNISKPSNFDTLNQKEKNKLIGQLRQAKPIKELTPDIVKKFMDEMDSNISVVDNWFKLSQFKI